MTLSQSEQQKQRRRSVLKAVAGAPVIFTLSAGTDVAAASITCVNKSATLAASTNPFRAASSTDTWVRYRVQRKKIKITLNGTGQLVTNAFTLGSDWYLVDGSGVVSNVTAIRRTNYTPVDLTNQFYFLLVDHAKYLTSTITSPQSFVILDSSNIGIAPVAGASCWNSVTPPGNQVSTNNILS